MFVTGRLPWFLGCIGAGVKYCIRFMSCELGGKPKAWLFNGDGSNSLSFLTGWGPNPWRMLRPKGDDDRDDLQFWDAFTEDQGDSSVGMWFVSRGRGWLSGGKLLFLFPLLYGLRLPLPNNWGPLVILFLFKDKRNTTKLADKTTIISERVSAHRLAVVVSERLRIWLLCTTRFNIFNFLGGNIS